MKNKLLLFVLVIVLCGTGCGSVSDYSSKTFNQQYFDGKKIAFTLNDKSVKQITYEGMIIGIMIQPNVELAYKDAIIEMAQETKLNLNYIENASQAAPSDIIVDGTVTQALWSFGFSTAKMQTKVNYRVMPSDKMYYINGIRKSGGGAEQNNLKKSFKNALYSFLKELEKQ